MAEKSIWLRTAEFVSGVLLAGGKAGDPLGQKTHAAHGVEGAKLQLQSQRDELGAPRSPGGYHERTGADIAKQVKGTWHDYGLGMSVPLGLFASQLSSEFTKSPFRKGEGVLGGMSFGEQHLKIQLQILEVYEKVDIKQLMIIYLILEVALGAAFII